MARKKPRPYPWAEWTDGKEHVARYGEDFSGHVEHFRSMLHTRARTTGLRCDASADKEAGTVTFSFRKREGT